MANHLQADKTSEVDEGPQTPQMVARAADLTRYLLYSDPDRLAHSQAVARRAESLAFAVDPRICTAASRCCLAARHWLGARTARHRLPSHRRRAALAEHRLASGNLQPGRQPLRGALRRHSFAARPATGPVPVLPGCPLRRPDRRRPNHRSPRRSHDRGGSDE